MGRKPKAADLEKVRKEARNLGLKHAGRGADQFIVRLPPGMRDAIAKAAESNGRSMNAQVVHALAVYFATQPISPEDIETVPDLERGVANLLKEVSKIADAAARITQKK